MIYNVRKISFVKIDAKAIDELDAIEVKEPNKKTKKNVATRPGIPDIIAVVTGIIIKSIAIHKNDIFNLVFNDTLFDIG